MTLSAQDLERLADVVELQPTKNGTLQERWGMDSGSDVHRYLEDVLSAYYYRDENSLIRATDEAAELVDVAPGIEGGDDEPLTLRVPTLERDVLSVLPEPDGRSMSVVAVLQALRDEHGLDPTADAVREALQTLRRKNAVSVTYRLVPTYTLAIPREQLRVEVLAAEA